MPGIRIPQENERGMAMIKGLSDAEAEQVLQVLNQASSTSDLSDIGPMLVPILPDCSQGDVEKLVDTLYTLYFLRTRSDVSLSRFVDDLAEAAMGGGNPDTETLNTGDLGNLKKRLKALLTVPSLSMISKAHGFQADFTDIFMIPRKWRL